jgi:uncharacterized protein (DUF2336 family)
MATGRSLFAELEDAIKGGSKERRIETLRRITDLFVAEADRLSDQQIELFDDVLGQMIERIERRALIELSKRLAPINNAPIEAVRRLARNDDIAVAEPVLTQSARLSDNDLVEIAETKTQAHMLAISSRPRIGSAVTDVLLRRGDGAVFHNLADNPEASFSERGFAALVRHAERDDQLAEKVGLRFDIPLRLFRELLARATETVRAHLLAHCPPDSLGRIQSVLANICMDAKRAAGIPQEQDYVRARARVRALHNRGELDERAILEFARTLCYAEIVAALALLSDAPVKLMEKLLQSEHLEAFLIPCKASGLSWPAARLILTCRTVGRQTSGQDLERAERDYPNLSINNAQRVLRFWQVRQAAFTGAEHSPGEEDRIAV